MASRHHDPSTQELKRLLAGASEAPDEGRVRRYDTDTMAVEGLTGAATGDLVRTESGVLGQVLGLYADRVHVGLLDRPQAVRIGERVRTTGHPSAIPCSDAVFGRVLDPLGRPLDGGGPVEGDQTPLTSRALPRGGDRYMGRFVTGLFEVDLYTRPWAGTNVLVMGKHDSGRSEFALDMLIGMLKSASDRGPTRAVYVLAGRTQVEVAVTRRLLEAQGVADAMVLITTRPGAPAALSRLAPLAGALLAARASERGVHTVLLVDGADTFSEVEHRLLAWPGQAIPSITQQLGRIAAATGANTGTDGIVTALWVGEHHDGEAPTVQAEQLIAMTDLRLVVTGRASERAPMRVASGSGRAAAWTSFERPYRFFPKYFHLSLATMGILTEVRGALDAAGDAWDAETEAQFRRGLAAQMVFAQPPHTYLTVRAMVARVLAWEEEKYVGWAPQTQQRFQYALDQHVDALPPEEALTGRLSSNARCHPSPATGALRTEVRRFYQEWKAAEQASIERERAAAGVGKRVVPELTWDRFVADAGLWAGHGPS